mgnify:CR=1 FL=1
MNKFLILMVCCLSMLSTMAIAQDEGFQPAKIIAFERVANSPQHPEKADTYKMSLRMGDAVYMCQGNGPVATFNDWTVNKELPAKADEKAKTMNVKNFDGKLIELKILKTKR